MDINKLASVGEGTKPSAPQQKGKGGKSGSTQKSGPTSADLVDISPAGMGKRNAAFAASAMDSFKSALADTLSAGGLSPGQDGLYDLTGTGVDRFLRHEFQNLPADSKKEFMKTFDTLSRQQGGLVPQSLIQNTFGQTNGFERLISSIGTRLALGRL